MNTAANQASTISRQLVNDNTNLPSIQYCTRVQRNSGQTGTTTMAYNYNFETANSVLFAGKTITVSFYARAGANFSPTSGILNLSVYTGTGSDQNIQTTGFTGSTLAINQNNTLTTTWQRFTATYAVPATVRQFAYVFIWTPTGTAGANDYFEMTGVQMELGSTATTFSRTGGTIQGELAACQRYYQKSYNQQTAPATVTSFNNEARMSANRTDRFALDYSASLPVTMRTAPTVTLYSPATGASGNVRDAGGGADKAATALSIGDTRYQVSLDSGVTTSANAGHTWHWVASAEL
jgi:hypothetical protein